MCFSRLLRTTSSHRVHGDNRFAVQPVGQRDGVPRTSHVHSLGERHRAATRIDIVHDTAAFSHPCRIGGKRRIGSRGRRQFRCEIPTNIGLGGGKHVSRESILYVFRVYVPGFCTPIEKTVRKTITPCRFKARRGLTGLREFLFQLEGNRRKVSFKFIAHSILSYFRLVNVSCSKYRGHAGSRRFRWSWFLEEVNRVASL